MEYLLVQFSVDQYINRSVKYIFLLQSQKVSRYYERRNVCLVIAIGIGLDGCYTNW